MKKTLAHGFIGMSVVIAMAAAELAVAADSSDTKGSFKGPIGLQLYSLRAQFAKDVPGTLDIVKGFGIKYAELAGTYGESPEKFKEALQQRGIQPISGHFPYEKYRDSVESIVSEAKALGLKYAGCAWVPHTGAFTEKQCRETAAVFNKAGEALGKEGIKFFYHTHGYEFEPHGDGTLFDLLMSETDPKKVTYEMDVFWVVHPGQDPVKLLHKYSNRWELMHLKDMRKGIPTGLLTGSSPVTNDVTIGTGQIDIPAVLKAAQAVGVKWYFLEDESPISEEQIPQSLKYLHEVRF
jgi:sugar phosphate isomerase/epimerase